MGIVSSPCLEADIKNLEAQTAEGRKCSISSMFSV